MDKIILITGATSGFGKAIAKLFAENKWNLILTGRRKERLVQLCSELEQKNGIKTLPLVFDVQDRNAVFASIENIPDEWKRMDVLVNNAGLALGREPFDKASIDDWETMLNTNVKGLMYVTKAALPYMITQQKGHIINIGSIAGKEVYVNGNGYCASKHAADALSKAMRIDLLPHKIKVTAIHPGAAETEFSIVRFKGNETTAKSVYEGYTPLYAEDIANITYYCATLPAHVCINELIVTCTAQANSALFVKE
ncbi:SDR family NAD(P)-dependent oxidoreductase [Hydrotalea sp.]|uniref:SDR family NAD(P)-dependent oxidoreductase n=1 Tax=Hydrotalea sp. TaxID=2881279 RepID=UPI00260A31E4|nr:SDR family NAD(P)-dependent oxidoreductase [Hydrotalea sp.]